MKHLGRIAALIGFFAAIWLFWRDNPTAIFALMRTAGVGLLLAALPHVLAMLANAKDWQTLIFDAKRPSLGGMLHLVWLRESVNCMLPVARIGGEIVSFRLMRQRGMDASTSTASLIVDTQLTLISQLMFTLVGIGYLLTHAASNTLHLAGDLAWGVVALAPVLVLFALVQHVKPFERVARLLNRVTSGKLAKKIGQSAQIDQAIKAIWQHRGVVLRYLFVWQTLQCLATALELWIALYFLKSKIGLGQAFVFESLLQAISSAAFFVPGNLGVQEASFVLIGGAFGLSPAACLALAGSRRVRDLLVFGPGLIAWQITESRAKQASQGPREDGQSKEKP